MNIFNISLLPVSVNKKKLLWHDYGRNI